MTGECVAALRNTIYYYEKDGKNGAPMFIFKWKVDPYGDGSWLDIGETRHTVYVTLAQPVTDLRQETLFYIGCRYASGKTTDADMIAGAWGHVAGRQVRRVNDLDGEWLTYYGQYDVSSFSTASLLTQGDGRCGAWMRFFLDVLKIQGFQQAGNDVAVTTSTGELGFFIKEWRELKKSGGGTHPYQNAYQASFFNPNKAGYIWINEDLQEQSGIPGQGTANPHSIFSDHALAYVNNIYYDPSYGKTFSNLHDFQREAIYGYFNHIEYPNPDPNNSFSVFEVRRMAESVLIMLYIQEGFNDY